MSAYFKYDFISPNGIYSVIKEELKSYFDTGAIDDLMFPTYLNDCLSKLGKGSYVISEEILYLEDFETRLPDNFKSVREAWMCAEIPLRSYQTANSFYSQTSSTTIQIEPLTIGGDACDIDINCPSDLCPDMPEVSQAVYKTNSEQPRSFRREFLLLPGNLSAKQYCDLPYTGNYQATNSPYSAGYNTFDIRDNKFVTTFRRGTVYLIFYATDYDDIGNQLVPDNYRINQYIRKFLKFKMFETLTNQVNDETFNQLRQKMLDARVESDEAYILAESELKKQTVYQKQRAIKKQLNSFAKYELPTRSLRNNWRRN